jgi:catechol 2,3-dioxygenase-like lactoylglutathione lyase family enzyme
LVVANLQRSIDFYANKLGFVDPNVHGDPPCFAMLNRDGFDLMLSLAESPNLVRPNGPSGVWDIYLSVADIADESAALAAAGITIDKGPTDMFYQMREIEVIDPDGYRLCLAQDISGEPLRDCETMSGVLDIGSAKLRLVLKLESLHGKLIGSLDSLDQNAYNLPIDVVVRDGATLRFEMKQLLASFEGKYSHDETMLEGRWSQRGLSWPLVFTRS